MTKSVLESSGFEEVQRLHQAYHTWVIAYRGKNMPLFEDPTKEAFSIGYTILKEHGAEGLLSLFQCREVGLYGIEVLSGNQSIKEFISELNSQNKKMDKIEAKAVMPVPLDGYVYVTAIEKGWTYHRLVRNG